MELFCIIWKMKMFDSNTLITRSLKLLIENQDCTISKTMQIGIIIVKGHYRKKNNNHTQNSDIWAHNLTENEYFTYI